MFYLGKDAIYIEDMFFEGMNLKIVGIKYYYDNNLPPKCLFTEEGFRTATALHYLMSSSDVQISLSSRANNGKTFENNFKTVFLSFDMPADKIYVDSPKYQSYASSLTAGNVDFETTVNFKSTYYDYSYRDEIFYDSYMPITGSAFERTFTKKDFAETKPTVNKLESYADEGIIMSDELIRSIAESALDASYKQTSLFFKNDKEAYKAAEKLHDAGYIAVPSDTTYEPDALTTIANTLFSVLMLFVWVLAIVFLAFFINLCSSRVLAAFKEDMAIMRSMGIPVTVIRIGMYVRMLVSLIPAFLLLIASAFLIFTTPSINQHFTYLYAWQYVLIVIGVLLLTVRITYKQISKLFGESVKKSLKGGKG